MLNDYFIVFSCGSADAKLDHRAFGSILPRYPIIQAVVRLIDGQYYVIHCHTGREEEVNNYITAVMADLSKKLSVYGSVIYSDITKMPDILL